MRLESERLICYDLKLYRIVCSAVGFSIFRMFNVLKIIIEDEVNVQVVSFNIAALLGYAIFTGTKRKFPLKKFLKFESDVLTPVVHALCFLIIFFKREGDNVIDLLAFFVFDIRIFC